MSEFNNFIEELKATTVYDAYWKANSVGEGTGLQVYIKSEADAYINKLAERHLRDLQALEKYWTVTCESRERAAVGHATNHFKKVITYRKYKRCLDMVKWCKAYRNGLSDDEMSGEEAHRLYVLYGKWMNRWRELAEKFKETK